MYRPLLLVGPTGSGKTTVVRTLVDAAADRGATAIVTTARDWAAAYADAIANHLPHDAFPGSSLVVIEHLEDLCGRVHTLDALARSLLEGLHGGGSVVVTATIPRAAPDAPWWIKGFGDKLSARLVRRGFALAS